MTTKEVLDALLEDDELYEKWSRGKIDSEDVIKELTSPTKKLYEATFKVKFKTTKKVDEGSIEFAIRKGVIWSLDTKSIAAPLDVELIMIIE